MLAPYVARARHPPDAALVKFKDRPGHGARAQQEQSLPAASPAATAAETTSAAAAAASATTLGTRASLVDCECPAAELLAVGSLDGSFHVLLGNIDKPESLVLDDPDLLYGAERIKQLSQIILGCRVWQVPYIK